MKYNKIPKQAMICLLTGLLLTSFTPLISKHMAMPDFTKGFLNGLGLTLEFIALVRIQRSKKEDHQCIRVSLLKNKEKLEIK